jgi:hypothetical protein
VEILVSLKEQLQDDLKLAMKEKDIVKKNAVQMLKAAVLSYEKDNLTVLDDAGITEIIAKELKKRKSSLVEYEKSDREDLISDLKKIGCKTIYIDGSFITRKILPKDIDVCWDRTGVNLVVASYLMPILWDLSPYGRKAQQKKYHSDVFPADIMELSSSKLFMDFFQHDKNTGTPKGIIKLEI